MSGGNDNQMGDVRYYAPREGVVVRNDDPKKLGRVKVSKVNRHSSCSGPRLLRPHRKSLALAFASPSSQKPFWIICRTRRKRSGVSILTAPQPISLAAAFHCSTASETSSCDILAHPHLALVNRVYRGDSTEVKRNEETEMFNHILGIQPGSAAKLEESRPAQFDQALEALHNILENYQDPDSTATVLQDLIILLRQERGML